ncbi:MAG: PilZ domain-containing protein [Proteobacteria bacterium]|nr:PilZ domain-containing protein [Pseudomonadota bacterium]
MELTSTLRAELSIARRHGRFLMAAVVGAMGLALAWTALQPRVYRASTTVSVGSQGASAERSGPHRPEGARPSTYVSTQAYLACSAPVLRRAARALRQGQPGDGWSEPWARRRTGVDRVAGAAAPLAERIDCRPDVQTAGRVEVAVEHATPGMAARIARAIASAYVGLSREQARATQRSAARFLDRRFAQAHAAVAQARAALQASQRPSPERPAGGVSEREALARALGDAQRRWRVVGALRGEERAARRTPQGARVVTAAVVPTRPSRPPTVFTLALALVVGLVCGRLGLHFAPRLRNGFGRTLHPALWRESVPGLLSAIVQRLEAEMEIVKVRPRNGKHFLELYEATLEHGGVHCATLATCAVGTPILADVYFRELPNPVLVRGQIVARRALGTKRSLRAGGLVAFDDTEAAKRDFLLRLARSQALAVARRRHVRLPVDIAVQWSALEMREPAEGALRDLSIGGTRLVAAADLALGSNVNLRFTAPGATEPVGLDGTVVYASTPQYGIQFAANGSGRGAKQHRELIRRLVQM